MVVQLQNISKTYDTTRVLHNLSLELHAPSCCGIVGKNGEGKTTLLQIIAGIEKPDSGTVHVFPEGTSIGYHTQFIDPSLHNDDTVEGYMMQGIPELYSLYTQLQKVQEDPSAIPYETYIHIQQAFEEMEGYAILGKIPMYLAQLSLADIPANTLVSQLSGGQKTRLQLATLLLQNPDILLLDEPTNHLDKEAIAWLESYIQGRTGLTIIVSHDRSLLNNVCNKIFAMQEGIHTLYDGNYDSYRSQMAAQLEKERMQYQTGVKKIKKLTRVASRKESEARSTQRNVASGFSMPYIRKMAGQKARSARIYKERIEKQIKTSMPEKPKEIDTIKFAITPSFPSGQDVLRIQNLSYNFGDHSLFKNVSFDVYRGEKVVIAGENGSGKTTLLKLIVGILAIQGGTIHKGANVSIGYFSQEHETLDPNALVIEEFQKHISMSEEDARTFLYFMLFSKEQVFQKIHTLSQGEKSKLVLAILLASEHNVLLLDEPTNHLDIQSREVLESALASYKGTIVIVSHDRYFLAALGVTKTLQLQEGTLKNI